MSFWHDFLTHNDKPAGKWSHYFPAYDRHFTSWKDKSITFLEIGTASGGSMQLWRGFFGPKSRIISIDIMPKCKELEEPGTATFISSISQASASSLENLLASHLA